MLARVRRGERTNGTMLVIHVFIHVGVPSLSCLHFVYGLDVMYLAV